MRHSSPAVIRQGLSDAQRRVAGEGADLDRASHTDGARQQADLLPLVRRDLHARARHLGRLLAQAALQWTVAQPVAVDIVGERAVDLGPALH